MTAANNSANSAPRDADALDGADRRTVSSQAPVAATPVAPRSLKDVVSGGDADFPEPTLLIEEGQVIASRFKIIKKLGEGGMGLVFQAHDPKLKRHVVLKFIKRELAAHEHMVERLLEEAAAAAALDHQHIVKIYDRDRDSFGDFLVMQHINGPNLLELLANKGGKLPIERAVRYAQQVGSALQRAHEANILHRDVKPSNILIDEQDNAILADWGLARILDEAGQTRSGAVIGTLDYMAPEVLKKASNASPLSDLYSLAATLYQLLTGRSPKMMRESLIPEPLRDSLLKALEDAPSSRHVSVTEFLKHLPTISVSTANRTDARPASLESLLSSGMTAGKRMTLKVNAVSYAFHWCPPSKFVMGSPPEELGRLDDEDQVDVRLTQGFWIMESAITQEMWHSLMRSRPWKNEDYVVEGPNVPATYINWHAADSFCQRFNVILSKSSDCWRAALPTEAQWEYACRAGTETSYSFGTNEGLLDAHGWYEENADGAGEEYAHEVRLKAPNPWGLFDMHGNVWEWCLDEYDRILPGGANPLAVDLGTEQRVVRGGSWAYDDANCRSAARGSAEIDDTACGIGFRVVLVKCNDRGPAKQKSKKK